MKCQANYGTICQMVGYITISLLGCTASISPNRFICRGSYGLGKGALICIRLRWRCRGAFYLVIYSTWWHLPSKTHGQINILIELLHFSWEGHHFSKIWPPNASSGPPQLATFQMLPKWSPNGSQNASQMLPRCFPWCQFSHFWKKSQNRLAWRAKCSHTLYESFAPIKPPPTSI